MKTVSKKKQKQIDQGAFGQAAPAKSNAPISAPFGVLNASKSVPQVVGTEELIKGYQQCESMDRCVDIGLHILHNPVIWKSYYVNQNPGLKRALRVLVQIQTIQTLLRGRYYLPIEPSSEPGAEPQAPQVVSLDRKKLVAPALSSLKYDSDHQYSTLTIPFKPYDTVVQVIAGDCLEAALAPPFEILAGSKEPLVLDMASMSLPGGGWRKASAAQEENLHRRTNLMHCLEDPYRVHPTRRWDYPIPQFGGLYIPGVTVFRGSEANGYPFLATPKTVSIVAAAALKLPPTETDPRTGEEVLDRKLTKDTQRKIEAILSIALENGHNFLVLSAFGCGAYMNPPRHIARIFRQVLNSERFLGRFSHVIFAITDSETKENSSQQIHASEASSSSHAPETPSASLKPNGGQGIKEFGPKTSKPIIFADTFGVDVLNSDGTVLHKHTPS
jgi:uncharacterized protein (TIGR02452 family)